MDISFVKSVQNSRSIDRSVGDLNHNSTIPWLKCIFYEKGIHKKI